MKSRSKPTLTDIAVSVTVLVCLCVLGLVSFVIFEKELEDKRASVSESSPMPTESARNESALLVTPTSLNAL